MMLEENKNNLVESKTPFSILLPNLGEKASEFLINLMGELGISQDADLGEWHKFYSTFFNESVLNLERQVEILKQILADMQKYRARKKVLLDNIQDNCDSLEEAAWWSINPTDSELGIRLSLGLKNGGCKYWQASKSNIGCTNCGYFAGIVFDKKVTSEQMLKQFERVLSEVKKQGRAYDVIEFLNDGSFLNDAEVYPSARDLIFEKVAQQKTVKRVAVETRPEHLTEKKIEAILNCLRKDQSLEIAFGLETTDLFIQNFCINKGYGTKEFEEALDVISKVNKRHENRVGVFVYALVKPAYLTEREAIEDAVKTGKYVAELSKKYDWPICVKFEPVVVADGTLLDVLFEGRTQDGKRRFVPPTYWSIVEIIARLEEANASKGARIGVREDMDTFKAIPATYHNTGMLSQYDFIIYDAVQRYNQQHDMAKLLFDIEIALNDKSLDEWKEKTGIDKPCFLSLYDQHKGLIGKYRETPESGKRREFLDIIFKALDEIEYGEETQMKAREVWSKNLLGSKEEIKKCIRNIGLKYAPDTKFEADNLEVLPGNLGLLRMQIKINYKNQKYGIWVGIPTTMRLPLKEIA